MKAKNLLKILFLAVFAVYFTGCSGKPVTFNSVDPKLYADKKSEGRTISGESSGFQLLLFIPVNINDRHQQAYDVLKAQANGDIITDIKITESWTYAFVGTIYTTKMTATAYPKK
jgi:flagellar basal body L-ring protein FlgH